jgi:hypothetical protein
MQDHICSGDKNGNNDTASKRNSVAEAVRTEDKNYGGRKCPGHWHEDDWLSNPYIVGKDGTKEECIEKRRVYFYIKLNTDAEFKRRVSGLRRQRIGCPGNCEPGACHLDVIVDYVNNLAADNNDNNGNNNSKQSRVADMAKANLEGNGVMFSSDKET